LTLLQFITVEFATEVVLAKFYELWTLPKECENIHFRVPFLKEVFAEFCQV
jgi:hypothetical protein